MKTIKARINEWFSKPLTGRLLIVSLLIFVNACRAFIGFESTVVLLLTIVIYYTAKPVSVKKAKYIQTLDYLNENLPCPHTEHEELIQKVHEYREKALENTSRKEEQEVIAKNTDEMLKLLNDRDFFNYGDLYSSLKKMIGRLTA